MSNDKPSERNVGHQWLSRRGLVGESSILGAFVEALSLA